MAAPLILPSAKSQFFDNNGVVLALGSIEITHTLTSAPAITYVDSIKSGQNTFPILLSAAGKADIYLDPGHYNIVSKNIEGQIVDTTSEYIVEEAAGGSEPTGGNVPIGGVVMYSGIFSNIPANWALCDGAAGTPNLSDRFVMGTVVYDDLGDIGGSPDAVLIAHQHSMQNHTHPMPHTHTYSLANHTHSINSHTHTIAHTHAVSDHNHAAITNSVYPYTAKTAYSSSVSGGQKNFVNGNWSTLMYTGDGNSVGTQAGIGVQFFSSNDVTVYYKTGLATGAASTANTGSKALTTEITGGGSASTGGVSTPNTGTTNTGDTGSTGASGVGENNPEFYKLAFIIRVT